MMNTKKEKFMKKILKTTVFTLLMLSIQAQKLEPAVKMGLTFENNIVVFRYSNSSDSTKTIPPFGTPQSYFAVVYPNGSTYNCISNVCSFENETITSKNEKIRFQRPLDIILSDIEEQTRFLKQGKQFIKVSGSYQIEWLVYGNSVGKIFIDFKK